jgi:hypothetical protein
MSLNCKYVEIKVLMRLSLSKFVLHANPEMLCDLNLLTEVGYNAFMSDNLSVVWEGLTKSELSGVPLLYWSNENFYDCFEPKLSGVFSISRLDVFPVLDWSGYNYWLSNSKQVCFLPPRECPTNPKRWFFDVFITLGSKLSPDLYWSPVVGYYLKNANINVYLKKELKQNGVFFSSNICCECQINRFWYELVCVGEIVSIGVNGKLNSSCFVVDELDI